MENKEITFRIERKIGRLGEPSARGWTKELNLVSWNDREAKYDIREWAADHETMGKGVTFTRDEALALLGLLKMSLSSNGRP